MTTFVCYNQGDARTLNLYDFAFGNPVFSEQSSTFFKVTYGEGNYTEFTGFDYVYDANNPNGAPISGATTSGLRYVDGEKFGEISDISITMEQAQKYIEWVFFGQADLVNQDVFKGSDTIDGATLVAYDDYLDGWGGADTLSGHGGSDTYVVDNVGDQVIEDADEGIDTVRSTVSFTLADNVENLTLIGAKAIKGTGNGDVNIITGSSAANTLDGLGGTDILIGGAGNDTYLVDRKADVVIEKAKGGSDTVKAGATYTLAAKQEIEFLKTVSDSAKTSISLTGNEFGNTITGNAGTNVLDGKLGSDILKGGAGKDTFFFNTKPSSANLDHIKDFRAVDDTIKLENSGSGLFNKLAKGGLDDDALAFVTSSKETVGDDVRILYDKAHGALYYDPNGGTAAGRVEFAVLDNHAALTYKDFLIV